MQTENNISPNYTVIVPVYNSAETLEELIGRIDQTMAVNAPYELLLIDDFSTDHSWKELIRIKAERPYIRLLQLTRNFGQAAATICGIREAKADIMVIIDDDLQYPPEEIPKLIEAFNPDEKYLLFGVPKEKKTGHFQKITTGIIEWLINTVIFKKKEKMRFSTFRILTKIRYKREEYNEYRMRSTQVFFTMVSPALMDYIYVDHQPRKKGKSQYNFFKKLRIALEIIMVTTEIPWHLFIFLTLFFILLTVVLVVLTLMVSSFEISNNLSLAIITGGFASMAFGFVLLFSYCKKIMMSYLGADAYAIWKEA